MSEQDLDNSLKSNSHFQTFAMKKKDRTKSFMYFFFINIRSPEIKIQFSNNSRESKTLKDDSPILK